MQHKFFGDKRDVVKWGVLLELARQYHCSEILQVLFLRYPQLIVNGKKVDLDQRVAEFFADLNRVEQGLSADGLRVCVFTEPWSDRRAYFDSLVTRLDERPHHGGPRIAFLDPDNGLARKTITLEHVTGEEVRRVRECLRSDDVLVLYQHRPLFAKGETWVGERRADLARALGLEVKTVGVATGPDLAKDVAFYFCLKDGRSRTSDLGPQVEGGPGTRATSWVPHSRQETGREGQSAGSGNQCPLCEYVFRHGWNGIDSHWRSRHRAELSYLEFKQLRPPSS